MHSFKIVFRSDNKKDLEVLADRLDCQADYCYLMRDGKIVASFPREITLYILRVDD